MALRDQEGAKCGIKTTMAIHVQEVCGLSGEINGSMAIKRGSKPECSVVGIMDANDEYLDDLRKLK